MSKIHDSLWYYLSCGSGEFEFPRRELPSCFHFTGSFNNPASRELIAFPYEQLTGQPLIYAYLGTLQNQLLWIFEMIAAACAAMDVQLVQENIEEWNSYQDYSLSSHI